MKGCGFMNENEIYDVDTFDGLSQIIDDKMSELRAENDPKKQLEHLAVVEKAVKIRKGISVNEEPEQEPKKAWLDTPTTTRQFIADIVKGLAIPILGLVGTLGSAKILANSQERQREMEIKGKKELLAQVAGIEEEDVISKHQLDIVNGLK
jgi:hypothetical protein